jgi:type II secretory pathway pseudopilin PulG
MRCGRPAARAGVLLEVLVSLALFAVAAAFALSASRSVIESVRRSRLQQRAADIARSKMTELEAGLTPLSALRGGMRSAGTPAGPDGSGPGPDESLAAGPDWELDVAVRRTEFRGLSLIELTVSEAAPSGRIAPAHDARVRYTLRQLVRLSDIEPSAFEPDDLLRGLPEAGP